MTPLRQRMTEDMQVRNLSPRIPRLLQCNRFPSLHATSSRSPEVLGPEDIRSYQVYLTNEKKLAPGSILIAVAALRFLYKVTLHKDWSFEDIIPAPKKPQKLPIVLSPEEVQHFLACVPNPKHRTILTTCYAAGLRVSETVRLKPTEIDSQRMVIRVEQGKGQKDRYVMLSPKLLEILREWWRMAKPKPWLFPGDIPAAISPRMPWSWCAGKRIEPPASPNPSRRTPCGTPSRSISSSTEPTCGPSNCCSVIAAWRPPPATRIATSKVCSTTSPFDLLPQPVAMESKPAAPQYF